MGDNFVTFLYVAVFTGQFVVTWEECVRECSQLCGMHHGTIQIDIQIICITLSHMFHTFLPPPPTPPAESIIQKTFCPTSPFPSSLVFAQSYIAMTPWIWRGRLKETVKSSIIIGGIWNLYAWFFLCIRHTPTPLLPLTLSAKEDNEERKHWGREILPAWHKNCQFAKVVP